MSSPYRIAPTSICPADDAPTASDGQTLALAIGFVLSAARLIAVLSWHETFNAEASIALGCMILFGAGLWEPAAAWIDARRA